MKVLLFHTKRQKGQQIQELCQKYGIECKVVPPAQFSQAVGYLCGLPGWKPLPEGEPVAGEAEEMMLLFGFTNAHLYDFLEKFKQHHIAPVSLKAAVTPTNVNWTARQLHAELMRERAQLKGYFSSSNE